jgi:hypothetical protein
MATTARALKTMNDIRAVDVFIVDDWVVGNNAIDDKSSNAGICNCWIVRRQLQKMPSQKIAIAREKTVVNTWANS